MLTRADKRKRQGHAFIVGGLILLGAAFSLGGSGIQAGEVDAPTSPYSWIDWDNPIGGVSVTSVEEAQSSVIFDIVVPTSLGTPKDILVTDFPPQPESVVAFIYDHPAYGRVVIEQHIPDVPPSDYVAGLQELVDMSANPTHQGTALIVELRDGDPGFLTTSEDGLVSELWWLTNSSVEVIIRGPSLDAAACLSIVQLI